jgi:hypothetical protein
MKKLFTIVLLLTSISFFAQTPPVIEGTYYPVRNTSIKQVWDTTPGSIAIPSIGANQVWDYRFSNGQFLNVCDTLRFKILDPANTPYHQYFPTANQAAFIRSPFKGRVSDSLYYYFKNSVNDISIVGGFNIQNKFDSTIAYSNSEFYAPSQITYNASFTDTARYVAYAKKYMYLSNEYAVKLRGCKIKTVQYVGYGTLRLPNGDYNNVALIKESYVIKDTVYVDFTNNGNYINTGQVVSSTTNVYQFFRNNTFGSAYLAYFAANPSNTQVAYGWYTLPVDFGSISGNVYTDASESTPVTNGEMYLYRENSNFAKNDILAKTTVNNSGYYKFDSIPFGEYRICVRPNTTAYPNANITYFGDTTNWIDATAIITTTTTSPNHKIHLQYHNVPVGLNTIGGQLGLNLNIFRTSGTNSNPIPSIGVVVKRNPGSSAARMGVTDPSGQFNIGTLDDGNYTLFVDIPGLHHSGTYTFSVNGGSVLNGLDFTVGTDSIHPTNATVGIKELKRSTTGFMTAYPNPYSSLATIAVNLPSSAKILLEVYDVLGKKIQTLDNSEKQQGVHKYNFSAKNLNYSSGMYFVKLTIGSTTDVIKIVEQ